LGQFKALHALTSETGWCFPATNLEGMHVCTKSVSKQIGDRQSRFKERPKQLKNRRQDDTLVLSKGDRGEWTPHDLRRTAATMMQQLDILPDIIDRC
jgi:integrase